MSAQLQKPYYRIFRPGVSPETYIDEPQNASNRLQLSRSYLLLEEELKTIFNYIEPCDENLETYSMQLYALLLRACTEVELNCKLILQANHQPPNRRHYTMYDYKKIEQSSKLSKYIVKLRWRKSQGDTIDYTPSEFHPFEEFGMNDAHSPSWYQAYNAVKHNREQKFENANLCNCLNAIAGVLVLLYSQFGPMCIETFGSNLPWINWDNLYLDPIDANILFELVPPDLSEWPEEEQYGFNWTKADSETQHEFVCFPFQ